MRAAAGTSSAGETRGEIPHCPRVLAGDKCCVLLIGLSPALCLLLALEIQHQAHLPTNL